MPFMGWKVQYGYTIIKFCVFRFSILRVVCFKPILQHLSTIKVKQLTRRIVKNLMLAGKKNRMCIFSAFDTLPSVCILRAYSLLLHLTISTIALNGVESTSKKS